MENGTTQWRLFCPRVHQASGGPNTAVAVESRELMAMTIWLLAQNSHSRDRFVARHNGWAVADHSWFSQWAKSYLLATLFNAIERPWSCPVFCSSQFINTFNGSKRNDLAWTHELMMWIIEQNHFGLNRGKMDTLSSHKKLLASLAQRLEISQKCLTWIFQKYWFWR